MNHNNSLVAILAAATLGVCSSGDINISPATTVTDSNNTTVTSGAPDANYTCASYVNSGGQTIQGVADGDGNCTYGAGFASNTLLLQSDMTIAALANDGARIFEASLFVGKSYRTSLPAVCRVRRPSVI